MRSRGDRRRHQAEDHQSDAYKLHKILQAYFIITLPPSVALVRPGNQKIEVSSSASGFQGNRLNIQSVVLARARPTGRVEGRGPSETREPVGLSNALQWKTIERLRRTSCAGSPAHSGQTSPHASRMTTGILLESFFTALVGPPTFAKLRRRGHGSRHGLGQRRQGQAMKHPFLDSAKSPAGVAFAARTAPRSAARRPRAR